MSKLILITGATSGIGEACAQLFAKQGHNLVLTGRRDDRLQTLADTLRSEYHIEVTTLAFDVREKHAVTEMLEGLSDNLKAVDVLINNAGLSLGLVPLNEGSPDDWDTMIDTNIKGLLYVSRIVSTWMISRGKGHIVNLGSIAGKETYLNGNVYCATKHAVDSLNKAMRIDLLPHQIRVTAVHPGAVETEFSEVRFKGDKARAKKVYEGFQPLAASDVADAISYAISCPPHVNINDLVIMPTAQANSVHLVRS